MSDRALTHLKVVELCDSIAGAYCAKLLADLGAEVIKVERPGAGDDARKRGPFPDDKPHPEKSGLFLYLNTHKLGVTLDVQTGTGGVILRRLVEQADVFVEDNPPAVVRRFGLTYEKLKEANPRLVMTSITSFGQTGPYRDYKAYALNSFHGGGEGYLLPIQSPDLSRPPVKSGGLQADCVCGLSAAIATLAATYRREAVGLGQHIDVSRQDVLMTMVLLEIAMYANVGYVRTRLKRPLLTPLPMKCQDGYIMMSALTDREWNDLLKFMGNPAWSKDERFSIWLNRHFLGDEITPRIEEFVARRSRDELFHQLQADALAAAPANNAEDLVGSAQVEARGFFQEVDHPKAGRLKHPGVPYKFSRSPFRAERAAPLLGQHNELVYCERLGYAREDLVKLRESGAI